MPWARFERDQEVLMRKPASCALWLLVLAACGGDNPVAPTVPVPVVAGRYEAWNMWQVQFFRTRDGFTGSFYCAGSLTLSQSRDRLTGFAVVGDPCPPASFDLSGSVTVDGGLSFTTGGPRPSVGQCPSPVAASYSGVASGSQISLHATANLDCPGPGEGPHRFDYIITAYKSS
jgi:hypothetical protein